MRKNKSRIVSLASMVGITLMLALFFYNLPEFLASAKGIVFAAVWFGFAGVMLAAHAQHLSERKHRLIKMSDLKKEMAITKIKNTRAGKRTSLARAMRS